MQAHIIDSRGVYLSTEEVDPFGPQPLGAIYESEEDVLPEEQEGYTRMRLSGVWAQVLDSEVPAIPDPVVVYKNHTSLEYLDMFTDAEQRAVKSASMADVDVGLWYDKMLAAGFITYADPRTEYGLQALVDAGLLSPVRKAEIVSELTA